MQAISAMDSATHDLHYQRISELVYDEEKLVTVLAIANELNITSTEARTLLKELVAAHDRTKSGPLYLMHLLYGTLKDGNISLCVVKHEDLKQRKSLFKDISIEHLYSVQTGKGLDINVILSSNSTSENWKGSLKSKNCIKRNVKSKKLPVVQPGPVSVKPISASTSNSGSNDSKPIANGKPSPSSQKQNKSKQGGIAGFFAKAAAKSPKGQTEPLKPVEKRTNGNANTEIVKKETEDKKSISSQIEKSNEDKNSIEKIKDDKTNATIEKSGKNNQEQKTKKRKKENKNSGPNKKRKRIQEICDSDSSDMFDEEENDDIIEMSDEEPPPPPVTKPPLAPKNKKRKAVERNYEDEEGFMVTATEYIYETASEDEDKEPVKTPKLEVKESPKVAKIENKVVTEKENEKLNQPKESKAVGKGKGNKKPSGKQPTLMNFFKRS